MSKDIICVSDVEPLFDEGASCTRTWRADADPELNNRQIVNIGSVPCCVIGKITSQGGGFVTYRFSPCED